MFKCKACEYKDTVISDLKNRANAPDELRDRWIQSLQGQLAAAHVELDKKNREIKRLVDLILIKNGVAPVSDAANPQVQHIDPMEAFASMFEEVPDRQSETK